MEYNVNFRVVIHTDSKATRTAALSNVLVYSLTDSMIQFKKVGEKSACFTMSVTHQSDDVLGVFRRIRNIVSHHITPMSKERLQAALDKLGFQEDVDVDTCLRDNNGAKALNMELYFYLMSLPNSKRKKLTKMAYRLLAEDLHNYSITPLTQWVTVELSREYPKISHPTQEPLVLGVEAKESVNVNSHKAETFRRIASCIDELSMLGRSYKQSNMHRTILDFVKLYDVVRKLESSLNYRNELCGELIGVHTALKNFTSALLNQSSVTDNSFVMLGILLTSFDLDRIACVLRENANKL